jgi:hypothetical protein
MKRQDVNLIFADQPVDDAIRASHDLANLGILELGNGSARFREARELVGCRNQLSGDNGGVVRRILVDKGVYGGEI